MPLYMLDTDTVSYFLRGRTPTLDDRMATVSLKHLCISAVTWGELLYGVKRKEVAHRLAQLLDQFRLRVRCLAWDEGLRRIDSCLIAAQLHKARTRIGSMDAMIATYARNGRGAHYQQFSSFLQSIRSGLRTGANPTIERAFWSVALEFAPPDQKRFVCWFAGNLSRLGSSMCGIGKSEIQQLPPPARFKKSLTNSR